MSEDDFVFGDDPRWEEALKDCPFFVIVGTPGYFKNPLCFDQAHMAKKLNKLFLILLKPGVEIPEGFPIPDEDHYLLRRYDSDKKLTKAYMDKLLNELEAKADQKKLLST